MCHNLSWSTTSQRTTPFWLRQHGLYSGTTFRTNFRSESRRLFLSSLLKHVEILKWKREVAHHTVSCTRVPQPRVHTKKTEVCRLPLSSCRGRSAGSHRPWICKEPTSPDPSHQSPEGRQTGKWSQRENMWPGAPETSNTALTFCVSSFSWSSSFQRAKNFFTSLVSIRSSSGEVWWWSTDRTGRGGGAGRISKVWQKNGYFQGYKVLIYRLRVRRGGWWRWSDGVEDGCQELPQLRGAQVLRAARHRGWTGRTEEGQLHWIWQRQGRWSGFCKVIVKDRWAGNLFFSYLL